MTKSPPNRKRFTRLASLLLAATLAVPMVLSPMKAYAADNEPEQVSTFQFKYPKNPTFEEINQYAADHPFDVNLPDSYDIIPDIANEEINTRIGTNTSALAYDKGKADRDKLAGSLTQETLDNALNATNFMRVHAGLQTLYIHTNDAIGGYQWRAQAGAALMAELNSVTHNVSGAAATEAGIVNGVFGWAKAGPGGSNIVAGNGVANKMVNSFMPDIGNDKTGLSHRSYILNPALSGTGFGAANLNGTTNYKTHKPRGSAVAIFVTYFGADPDGLSAVLWPSRKQPIETFQARGTWTMQYPEGNPYQGNPWSYFINTNDVSVDTSTLKVTLTCDGKPTDVLDFNNLTATEKTENRLFTISSFPLKKLVAWRPHVAYGVGDKVTVNIEGLVDSQGLPVPVEYDVHFFKTGTVPYPNLTGVTADRAAPETASVDFTSDYAGTLHYLLLDADAPVPTADEVLGSTELALNEGAATLDFTALSGSGAKKLYYITTSTSGAGKDYATANANGEMSAVKSADIPDYQPVTPTVIAPTAKSLTYNGTAQELILAGSTTGGTMEYKLGDDGTYGTAIPTAMNAGDYTVYYRVTGDDTYAGSTEQSVSVTIEKATVTATAKSYEIYVNDQAPNLSAPAAGEHYTVSGLAATDVLDGTAALSYRKDGQTAVPDVTKAGAYDIVLSGIAEPAGGNYHPIVLQTGTLTISARTSSEGIHDIFEPKDNSPLEQFKARVLNRLLYLDAEIDVSDLDIAPNDIQYTVNGNDLTGTYAAREIVRQNPFYSTAATVGFPEFTYKDNGCVATVKYTYHPAWTQDFVKKVIASYDEVMAMIQPGDSDFAKILKIHDWIVKNVSYGMSTLYYDFAVGALANRKAVCSGYAQCNQFLLSQVGIESIYIAANTVKEPHAWNLVRLDGHWFHVDCTWDRGVGLNPNVNHTYFMLSDAEFNADGVHSEDWMTPAKGYPANNLCSIANKFYQDNKDIATDEQIASNPITIKHTADPTQDYQANEQEHWRTCPEGVEVDRAMHTGNPCTVCGHTRAATYTVSITTDGNGTASALPKTAEAGAEITLSATPETGYRFKEWKVVSGGVTITDNKFTMPANDVEVQAIFEKDVTTTYTVTYDWSSDFPAGETIPTNGNEYQSAEAAKAAVDSKYTVGYKAEGQKDGKDGTWTFSGWTATVEGTVVKFTGTWSFTEEALVDAAAPAPINLTSASYELGDTITALDGATTVSDDGVLTYQWYVSDAADNFNGTPVDGETGETYTPAISAAGTYYYYVVATNTKSDATGSRTASTTSNMAVISVREKGTEAPYTVSYDWGSDVPAGETLPTDGCTYQTEDAAKAAADTKYIAGFTVKAQKDGKNGTWTFSGWTAVVEGTAVKFTGTWTFTENKQNISNGNTSGSSSSYLVEAGTTANGKVTLSTTRAARGSRVTISVKPDSGYQLASLTVRDGNGNSVAVTKQTENTYSFVMPNSKVNVDASFAAIQTAISFRDVQRSDYFYDAVQWAVEKGITEGTSATTFSPNVSCTRAQMVTFLWRAAGSPAPKSTTNLFRDVSGSDYYYNAVLWAVENGITTGTGEGKFSPNATVTRGQAVTFLYRAAGTPAAGGNAGFSDVNANDYYNNAVAWAAQNGITGGTGNGKFSPNADCTRGQIVTLLYRANN